MQTDLADNPDYRTALTQRHFLEMLTLKAETAFDLYRKHPQSAGKYLQIALDTYLQASEMAIYVSNHYETTASKLNLAARAVRFNQAGIEATLANQHPQDMLDQLLIFMENSKSQALLRTLQKGNLQFVDYLPDSIAAREKQLINKLREVEVGMVSQAPNPHLASKEVQQTIQAYVIGLKNEYDRFTEFLSEAHPRYHELKYTSHHDSIESVQEKYLTPRSLLIEYFCGDDKVYALAISKESADFFPLEGEGIADLIQQYRDAIVQREYQAYVASATTLYQRLLQPILASFPAKEELIIIPDSYLTHMPFEALLQQLPADANKLDYRTLDYLVKEYQLRYHYSISLLGLNQRIPPTEAPADFIGLAPASQLAPDAAEERYSEVSSIRDLFRERYSSLEAIEDWFRSHKTEIVIAEAANRHAFLDDNLSRYRYVHVATHAAANLDQPDHSFLAIAGESGDAKLALNDVFKMNLDAELVTLSACETGMGKVYPGEGLIGLTRGILFSGGRNVLVSQWQVNNKLTSQFMSTFYQEMLSGSSRSKALQTAKLETINGASHQAAPFHWAAFILLGE